MRGNAEMDVGTGNNSKDDITAKKKNDPEGSFFFSLIAKCEL